MSKISVNDYAILMGGLTQSEPGFRDILRSRGYASDFFTQQKSAMNKLNHHLAGHEHTADDPVDVVAVINFAEGMIEKIDGENVAFDEFDERLISYLNQAAMANGRVKELPMTRIGMQLLDEGVFDDKAVNSDIAMKNLRRAFENEMILMVQLDGFVKSSGLVAALGDHRDDLMKMVGSRAYDYNFEDAVEELTQEVVRTNTREL